MRIISKHKDYYDKAMTFGGYDDDSILYLRKREEIPLEDSIAIGYKSHLLVSPLHVLGFCGNLYYFYRERLYVGNVRYRVLSIEEGVKKYYTERSSFNSKSDIKLVESSPVYIGDNIFLTYNVPIFSIEPGPLCNWVFVKNPLLKEFEFYKIMDLMSCYQSLVNYMTNILIQPSVEVPYRTDELIRDAHGHGEVSFKGESGAARRKRARAEKRKKSS